MAINSLLRAISKGGEATLTLQDGSASFTLVVRKVRLEKDKSGIFLFDAEADLGRVTGRLWAAPSVGQPVGRVTVSTKGE